jgi:NitT/TauT family transport system substrate-binding protein
VAGPSPEAARPLQRVAIGVAGGASLSWLPAQLAAVLGYYAEEGVEAQFVQASGAVVVPALLSGELLASTVISPVGANAGQGGDTRLVQFHAVRLQHVISVRPEIQTVEQLAGKRIAVQSLGTLTAHEARKVAEHYGLPDVAIIAVGDDLARIAALETGAADANVAPIPANLAAEQRGFPTLLRIGSLLDTPHGGFGTSLAHLRDQPDLLARTLRATARALPLITGQRERVIAVIREFMQLSPPDAERAYEMVADTYSPNGLLTPAQMAAYLELLRDTAGLPADVTADQIADFSLARRVAADLGLPQ